MAFEVLDFSRPIPPDEVYGNTDWTKNEIDASDPAANEQLFPVGMCTEYTDVMSLPLFHKSCVISPYKDNAKSDAALIVSYVRESIAKQLQVMADNLPPGIILVAADAYRPPAVQLELFNIFKNKVLAQHPELSDEEVETLTKTYVSKPNPESAPHMTGAAVDALLVRVDPELWKETKDLASKVKSLLKDGVDPFDPRIVEMESRRYQILRKNGELVDMGVRLSEVIKDEKGRPLTDTRYYETLQEEADAGGRPLTEREIECRDNRRMFFWAAAKADLRIYKSEYWHLGTRTKFQPDVKGRVVYGFIELSPENKAHLQNVEALYEQSVIAFRNLTANIKLPRTLWKNVMLENFGDPNQGNPKLPVCPAVGPAPLPQNDKKLG